MIIKTTVVITHTSKREYWGDVPISNDQIAEMAKERYEEEPYILLDCRPEQIEIKDVEVED